jgi:transcriptional regulator with XRE-family HTH domain
MSSFGEELKRERELRQITLREVSEATKINLRYLDALERNDFRHLPGGVFNKGFVRAYAQYIGIDPEAMVNAYLLEERAQQEARGEHLSPDVFRPSPPANGGRTEPQGDGGTDLSGRRKQVALWGAAAALVLLLVLAWALLSWLTPGADNEVAPAPDGPVERPADSRADPPLPEPASAREETEAVLEEAEGTAREVAIPDEIPDAPPEETPGAAPAGTTEEIEATIVLRRATGGRVNCDNRRVEILDGIPAGTELSFRCESFLLIDAQDGGAVLLGLGSSTPVPLGSDGVPVRGRRLVSSRAPGGSN